MATRAKSTVSRPSRPSKVRSPKAASEGWHGWDDYAAFYDWENAQTLGRRDLSFWQRMTGAVAGRTRELGCGTGRVPMPLGL